MSNKSGIFTTGFNKGVINARMYQKCKEFQKFARKMQIPQMRICLFVNLGLFLQPLMRIK